MKYYVTWMVIIFSSLTSSIVYSQTYNKIISDGEYYDFINKDILRDSIKVKHHIFRQRHTLSLADFYYERHEDIDSISRQNHLFIFKRLQYGNKTIINDLDTIFTRPDIDYFAEQIHSMTKELTWKSPLTNSVFIDSIKYTKKRINSWKRQPKWGFWRYSLPLFSLNKSHAIIIKSNSVGGAYYIYKRSEKDEWILIKVFNQWSED